MKKNNDNKHINNKKKITISLIIFNGAREDPKLGIENIDCAIFFIFPLIFLDLFLLMLDFVVISPFDLRF